MCDFVVGQECEGCEASFVNAWECIVCIGPVPAGVPCLKCDAPAPRQKIGKSEKLYHTDSAGNMVITAAGHAAATQGELEGEGQRIFQGRPAKAGAVAKMSATPVRSSLTMTKDILALKIWGGKTGELWQAPKAAWAVAGCRMTYFAGRFVGHFDVLRDRKFCCASDALEWLGHGSYVPLSPSMSHSLTFYYALFTKQRADTAAALRWDQQNKLDNKTVFYAWEDTHVKHYIVHDDGQQEWTFPQEQVRVKKEKAAAKSAKRNRSAPKRSAEVSYRGYDISNSKANILVANHADDPDIVVLGAVQRKGLKKTHYKILKLITNVTAFLVSFSAYLSFTV